MKTKLRPIAISAISILLTACVATPERIANRSTSFNLAVEQAHNNILLLNILRSSEFNPVYFNLYHEL